MTVPERAPRPAPEPIPAPADLRRLYARLVEEHGAALYRVAHRLCGVGEAPEDLLQDAYLEAWRSIHTLRSTDRARGWLFSILRHCWSRRRRRAASRPDLQPGRAQLEDDHGDAGPDVLARLSDREAVQHALASLPEPQRLALVLVYVEGLDAAAAAARLGVSRGTILSRVHRARRRLRTSLRNEDGGAA